MTLRFDLTPLLPTPFAARTEPLGKLMRFGAWAGYRTALCYGDTEMEYTAIRNTAMPYDLSPMTKYRISGVDAEEYLSRPMIRNISKLSEQAVQYSLWCDDAGKVLDDGTLFRLGLRDFDEVVQDQISALAGLTLQGPLAAAVLARAGFEVATLKPFRLTHLALGTGQVMISRTRFTGDLGYELFVTPDLALPLWDRLMEADAPFGLRPAGSDALNLARIEAGFLIATVDFIPAHHAPCKDRARSPFEPGFSWMMDFDKGPLAEVAAEHACGFDVRVEVHAEREMHCAKLRLPVTAVERPFFNPARKCATPPEWF